MRIISICSEWFYTLPFDKLRVSEICSKRPLMLSPVEVWVVFLRNSEQILNSDAHNYKRFRDSTLT
jgi:hypothetical protein